MNKLVESMPFAASLGMEITKADASGVHGSLVVREDLCTIGTVVHGGVLMSLADGIGAVLAFLNLPEGSAGTTTVESKTNFLRPASVGSVLSAEAVPVSVGRRLCVITTTIRNDEGKEISVTTQTQMVL